MTQVELQSVIHAIYEGTFRQWLSYLLVPIFSGLFAYFGAYLKRKGEDKASDEKFNAILKELRQTTNVTESIKQSLSNRTWLLQQQWAIREQKYAELLKYLTKFRVAIHEQQEYFTEPYDPHDAKWMQSISENSNFQTLGQRIIEADEVLRELIGPASIFLSDKTIAALNQMQSDNYGIANFSAQHLGEYVEETRKVVDAAYDAVLQEARSELAHHRSAGS